jgi:hypothetical protein
MVKELVQLEFIPGTIGKFTPPPSPTPPMLARYVNLTTFDLPEKANPNELVVFRVVGTVVAPLPTGHVASIAIVYLSGPASQITMTVNGRDFQLSQNEGVMLIDGIDPPVGTIISAGCWMKLSDAGKYAFRAITYYDGVTDNRYTPAEDTRQDKTIEILAAAAPTKEAEGWSKTLEDFMNTMLPLMMTMMMLMMMMSLMVSMMREFAAKKGD